MALACAWSPQLCPVPSSLACGLHRNCSFLPSWYHPNCSNSGSERTRVIFDQLFLLLDEWLISFLSLDAKTQISAGYSGAQPVLCASATYGCLTSPSDCNWAAPFTWKHCVNFYSSIFIVLGTSLRFHCLVKQMDKMGLEGNDVEPRFKGSDSQILLFSVNCQVISMKL